MKLIVGLGNPGPKYETTRHNVGWLALDRLADRWKAAQPQQKHQSEYQVADFAGEKVLLIKPLTFMNLSGRAVAPFFQFHKCEPSDVIVIHDELDLPPGSLRIKTGGGAGGHNGLKSLDECLGAGKTGYHRVRIGVGHPRELGLRISPADYVLQPFSDSEWKDLDPFLDRVAQAVERLMKGDVTGAMNEFNRSPAPANADAGPSKTESSKSGKGRQ